MEKPSALGAARTPRQRFWLEHLKACREQGLSLKGYAHAHELSVSALYAANSALKRRALSTEPSAPAPKLVPVRLAPAAAMVRVLLPNGVVVELPASIDPERSRALLAGARALP